ncbi:MAG: DUF6538 domain-containing protein [Roseiarcus sp.]
MRRGAVYHWRRRVPAAPGNGPSGVLIVSLGAKDLDEARRPAAILTHMSEPILAEVRRGELSPSEAQAIMLAVASEQIETLKRAAVADRALSGQVEQRFGVRPRHKRRASSAQCSHVAVERFPWRSRSWLIAFDAADVGFCRNGFA